jgi:hypothetical protein
VNDEAQIRVGDDLFHLPFLRMLIRAIEQEPDSYAGQMLAMQRTLNNSNADAELRKRQDEEAERLESVPE